MKQREANCHTYLFYGRITWALRKTVANAVWRKITLTYLKLIHFLVSRKNEYQFAELKDFVRKILYHIQQATMKKQ